MKNVKITEHPKGTVCLRCGMLKSEAKDRGFYDCNSWGKTEKHQWNKEPVKIETHIIKANQEEK